MNFSRGDFFDTSRSVDTSRKTSSENLLSLSFSSERFNFDEFEEETVIDSVDEESNLFVGFKKKEPTLDEALESMGYVKYKEIADNFLEMGYDKLYELDYAGMIVKDIAAISCYTLEWNEEARGKYNDNESPCRKLNNSLSVDRSNKALKKTRAFLFLLLKALRKLPRFVPENRTLYRGIKSHVQTEHNSEFLKKKTIHSREREVLVDVHFHVNEL